MGAFQAGGERAQEEEAVSVRFDLQKRIPCVQRLDDSETPALCSLSSRGGLPSGASLAVEGLQCLDKESAESGAVAAGIPLSFRVDASHGYACTYTMGVRARENKTKNGSSSASTQGSSGELSADQEEAALIARSKSSDWTPLPRWECRVVTPCLASGVDCFSGEGCGLLLCDRPISLFGSCCQVYAPEKMLINNNTGLVVTREVIRVSANAVPPSAVERAPSAPAESLQKKLSSKQSLPQDDKDCSVSRRSKPLKIFMGTWNTEYQEFAAEFICHLEEQLGFRGERPMAVVEWASVPSISSSSRSDSSIGASTTCTGDGPAVPPTVDSSETLGSDNNLQEGSSDENDGFELKDGEEALKDDPPMCQTQKGTQFLQRRSTMLLSKPRPGEQPLKDWVLPGYDVYVVTLQEVTNDNIFETLTLYLELEHGERFLRVDMGHGKIQGLGKGAWTKRKATSMACWIRESALYPRGPVKPIAYKAFSFTMINGSKGAVTLVLKMFDQLVCFIGCHMPASGVKERLRARQHIRRKLAKLYADTSDVDFTRVFHHLVWAGDFNFRLQTSVKECLPLLRELNIQELLKYDECKEDRGLDMELHKLKEAPVEFLPTYKKADDRPPLDLSDPDWVEKEYQMSMKKGMIGQRKVVQKPPSWCDRVFFWSMPDVANYLTPEPNGYFAAKPKFRNVLLASDHSPVGCGFFLHDLPEGVKPPRTFLQNEAAGEKKKRKPT